MKLDLMNLGHCYGNGTRALDQFNLTIEPGILGLLGPNGAGKSTLMSILATLLRPSEGDVLLNGTSILEKPVPLRQMLGYLPQHFGVYDQLSAPEFLAYMAAVKGVPPAQAKRRIAELLSVLNLEHAGKRRLGGFSGGMRQRVGIAQALLNDPKLLIIDEPTVGLDPEERVRFRRILADLAGDRIIILSTHIVSDVASIADQIVIVGKGRRIADASPDLMLDRMTGKVWAVTVPADVAARLEREHLVSDTIRRAHGMEMRLVADAAPTADAVAVAPSLEDAYLYHTRGAVEVQP